MPKCRCGAQTAGSHVCANCIEQHTRTLGDLPALIGEAITTLTRQDRIARRVGSRSAERPLPFNWNASLVLESANNTLDVWCDEIQHGVRFTTVIGKCGFLLGNLDWLTANNLGPQCVDEIAYLAHQLTRAIDLPTQRWFAGPCACEEPLYAHPAATKITCPVCGAVYTADERREWLRQAAEDALLPLPVIWAALSQLAGSRPPWSVVRRWPARVGNRRLSIRGVSLAGEELFRVGDVLEMVRDYGPRRRPRRDAEMKCS